MFREYSPYEITQATDKIYKHIIKDYNVRNQLGAGDGTNNMPKDLRNAIFYQSITHPCSIVIFLMIFFGDVPCAEAISLTALFQILQ